MFCIFNWPASKLEPQRQRERERVARAIPPLGPCLVMPLLPVGPPLSIRMAFAWSLEAGVLGSSIRIDDIGFVGGTLRSLGIGLLIHQPLQAFAFIRPQTQLWHHSLSPRSAQSSSIGDLHCPCPSWSAFAPDTLEWMSVQAPQPSSVVLPMVNGAS